MAPKLDPTNVIAAAAVNVSVDELQPYGKNPRKGDIEKIAESLKENGQFRAIIVQRSTNQILAGNHTYKAALTLGWKEISVAYVDVTDDKAKAIVLADNRTNDFATYDSKILADILNGMPTLAGTGYEEADVRGLLAGMQDRDAEVVAKVLQPAPVRVDFEGADEDDWDLNSNIKKTQERHDARFGDQGTQEIRGTAGSGTDIEKMRVAESIATLQYEFDKHLDKLWPSSNYWGIPDLRPDMLLDELPDPLTTWGGSDATPDDGKSTYIWNTGVAASKDLPWDRAITSFFTYDTKFDAWFDQPSFKVAQMVHNGCTRAIVPDTSFWTDDTRFHHMAAAYNAQWLARYMQECGVKIIPRFMWCDLESVKVGVLGIPKNPPIAAVCIQAINRKEAEQQMTPDGLRAFVKEIAPDALIVYGGGTAKRVVEDAHLPKELHVVQVDNYAAVRRHVVFDNATGKEAVEKASRKADRERKQAERATTHRANAQAEGQAEQ